MNYAYALGILEARITLRADALDRAIRQAVKQAVLVPPSPELDRLQDTLNILQEAVQNIYGDIDYAKQRGNVEMTTHHELHLDAVRQHDR